MSLPPGCGRWSCLQRDARLRKYLGARKISLSTPQYITLNQHIETLVSLAEDTESTAEERDLWITTHRSIRQLIKNAQLSTCQPRRLQMDLDCVTAGFRLDRTAFDMTGMNTTISIGIQYSGPDNAMPCCCLFLDESIEFKSHFRLVMFV